MYNKLLNIYKTQNDELKKSRKKRIKVKNVSENLTIDLYVDEGVDDLSQLEGDGKVKLDPEETIGERVKLNRRKRKNEGTGLKILTPNKLLLDFQYSNIISKIKAGSNSCKLKTEIKQILYILYQQNQITKKVYNNLIKSL